MIADTGAGLYACQASVDLFGLTREDFIEQVKDIITVGEFHDLAAGGQMPCQWHRCPDDRHRPTVADVVWPDAAQPLTATATACR